MGGFYQSRNAYLDFMERNQATAFNDHIHAKVCENYQLCIYTKLLFIDRI
jgi:hypothetical protein